jgi:hypothetical protein
MLRRGIAPATLVLAVVLVGWLVTGVSAIDIIRFVAYEIGFVALPGIALLWAIRGRRSHFLVSVALGWPLGQALEILAFVATAVIGVRGLFLLYPIVVVVPSAYVIWRRRSVAVEPVDADSNGMSATLMWSVAGTLSVGLIYLAIMFVPQAPLPGGSVRVEYIDFPYFLGLINQVSSQWPPTLAGLSGVPLPYEWFVFFHMAAASTVTHVSVPVIALRLDYIPTILVIACQLLALGRLFTRAAWTGAVAIVIVFLLGPLDLIASSNGTPFGDNVLTHLWDSWTFPFGLMFFLALLYLITERVRAVTWRSRGDVGSWVLIGILMIGASGAKATVLPVIIVGALLYVALHVLIRRSVPVNMLLTAVLGIVVFAVTYRVIYAGSAPNLIITPLMWLKGAPPVLFAETMHHALLRHILLPFAYAAALAGVLLPLAGALYLLRRRHRAHIASLMLPLCMLVAGVLITSAVHQSSYSELYFEDMGYVAGALVAAAGLRLAWLDLAGANAVARWVAIGAFAVSLVLLIGVVKATEHDVFTPESSMKLYAALVVAAVIIIVIAAIVLRATSGGGSGALALGLVPLVAAAALTSPLIVFPTVKKITSGVPVTTVTPVLGPGIVVALHWLRDHTSQGAVFAVNNHWIDEGRTNAKYYYYAAFSERQVFIEAYDPIRDGITPGVAGRAATAFAIHQRLNDEVFDNADVGALQTMIHDYAVRYLFVDHRLGTQNPALLQLGHVVFSNQDATIIAVG